LGNDYLRNIFGRAAGCILRMLVNRGDSSREDECINAADDDVDAGALQVVQMVFRIPVNQALIKCL